jgi:hypothetical protein
MVAVGLFALIMTLASGAYLVMIGINRQTQSITAGINDLSFALETMMRSIRTGTGYNCNGPASGDCSGGTSFYFTNASGATVSYSLTASAIQAVVDGVSSPLTDSSSVRVDSLTFYVSGTGKPPEYTQPHVTITVSGTISTGHGNTESFTVETGATMRGTDL